MSINIHSIFAINVRCPEHLTEWINYRDPLTDKLKSISGDAQLELISQKWVATDWWSKNLPEIEDTQVFQREILMKSHGISYWYARSIIPHKCYYLDPVFFDRLKNESIKNLIFGNNKVDRINMVNYPVDSRCIEFHWARKYIDSIEGVLWVRLSEFFFQQCESFYLAELMLPKLEKFVS